MMGLTRRYVVRALLRTLFACLIVVLCGEQPVNCLITWTREYIGKFKFGDVVKLKENFTSGTVSRMVAFSPGKSSEIYFIAPNKLFRFTTSGNKEVKEVAGTNKVHDFVLGPSDTLLWSNAQHTCIEQYNPLTEALTGIDKSCNYGGQDKSYLFIIPHPINEDEFFIYDMTGNLKKLVKVAGSVGWNIFQVRKLNELKDVQGMTFNPKGNQIYFSTEDQGIWRCNSNGKKLERVIKEGNYSSDSALKNGNVQSPYGMLFLDDYILLIANHKANNVRAINLHHKEVISICKPSNLTESKDGSSSECKMKSPGFILKHPKDDGKLLIGGTDLYELTYEVTNRRYIGSNDNNNILPYVGWIVLLIIILAAAVVVNCILRRQQRKVNPQAPPPVPAQSDSGVRAGYSSQPTMSMRNPTGQRVPGERPSVSARLSSGAPQPQPRPQSRPQPRTRSQMSNMPLT